MTSELLASISGVILSLVFSYVPGVKDWFESLSSHVKQAVMGGLLVVVSAAVFGLSCAGLSIGVECSASGAWGVLRVLLAALIGNQSAYLISKRD